MSGVQKNRTGDDISLNVGERLTFKKGERLTSESLFKSLFETGKRYSAYPVRLFWTPAKLKSKYPAQVAFGVGKARFPRAVDRNRIKRQMRESWRLCKSRLYTELRNRDMAIAVMVVYISPDKPSRGDLPKAMDVALEKLIGDLDSSE